MYVPVMTADSERPTILLTGGTGYVGGRLLSRLEADPLVVLADGSPVLWLSAATPT